MLVLLDENLPHRLRFLVSGHEVRTVDYQGWKSLSNGVLLETAEDAGFDVMVTADRAKRAKRDSLSSHVPLGQYGVSLKGI